jgi:hypothetical protein
MQAPSAISLLLCLLLTTTALTHPHAGWSYMRGSLGHHQPTVLTRHRSPPTSAYVDWPSLHSMPGITYLVNQVLGFVSYLSTFSPHSKIIMSYIEG